MLNAKCKLFGEPLIRTSYDGSISDLKKFSIKLVAELSPCHPGFHYDNAIRMCVCFRDSDIVSCSGRISSIKRSYWFGEVREIRLL